MIGATVVLLRQHGLLDAKAMVAKDPTILLAAAEKAKAQWEAEEAARLAEAEVPEEYAEVIDALKRSPLMLSLPGDAPGLDAVAHLVRGGGLW